MRHEARARVGAGAAQVGLSSPAQVAAELPLDGATAARVEEARAAVGRVLDSRDDRLLVVVGPCSVHDTEAALVYARRLRSLADELGEDLLVVMRTYFEKPRSTVGWTGLANDPGLDGTHDVETGLRAARRLLLDISALGLPTATEWLDSHVPAYLAELVGYGTIGARTVTSQPHRQLASYMPMPVGMKNDPGGSPRSAVEGIVSAASAHAFTGQADDGHVALLRSTGNPHAHLVLRGGADGPNYGPVSVRRAVGELRRSGLPGRVVIDASHANSAKSHLRQRTVLAEIGARIAAGAQEIRGVMAESFLEAGRQDVVPGRELVFGRSITDACMGWEATAEALRSLATAVRARRRTSALAEWQWPGSTGSSPEQRSGQDENRFGAAAAYGILEA